ncbi:hypothetical protein [Sphingomonas sp. GC_Shp_3]|uniref:hypothetical protein n=1 Tax=Sphingomonas sp. GC_Shp_3 TaxID=2937383 RepID=UPI00226A26E4|nr:hypothetical protein [Sphingomonas sp. GC_Shp_3]
MSPHPCEALPFDFAPTASRLAPVLTPIESAYAGRLAEFVGQTQAAKQHSSHNCRCSRDFSMAITQMLSY